LLCVLLVALSLAGVARSQAPDPREPGPLPTAVTVIDEGCDYDLDGKSLIWSDPPFGFTTPTTVVFGDHDYSGSDTRCPGNPAALVDMEVRVHYPGSAGQIAAGGPFPLVVFLHGQQHYSIPGYEGYDYLGQLLASHGFIVASIDGRSLLDSTIKSRGEHVREHLRRFVARNMPGSGSFLSGQLDLSQVALVGHSRGGDAVVATWEWQRMDPDPGYTIGAISAIAPVQFFGQVSGEPTFISHIRDVPYQIIHGSKDGDVSDFQGLRQYDRAADIRAVGETLKSMVFVKDANHNFFNTIWETLEGDDYCCGGTLAGPVVRDIAKVYIHAFLQVVIKGNSAFVGYLTGEMPNPVEGTTVALDFQAPGSRFTVLDHHEELPGDTHDRFTNSQGGAIVVTPRITRLTYQERFLAASEASPWNSYKGETFAARLAWGQLLDHLTSTYRSEVPVEVAAALDAITQDRLSFRVGQVFRATDSPNPTDQNQDFQVRLEDTHGNLSPAVPVSAYLSAMEDARGGIKTVMGVVRIPLSAFSGIDLRALRAVEFLFTVERAGEIVFDEIRFTQ
jgi:fermentation-respiration switch protein FrsA (DUF1100 family)